MTEFENFVESAEAKHGTKYLYLRLYKGKRKKIEYLCSEHGLTSQDCTNHLSGSGCYDCYRAKPSTRRDLPELWFLRATFAHAGKYTYTGMKYVKGEAQLRIVCETHGEYTANAKAHVYRKSGCLKCFHEVGAKEINRKPDSFFTEKLVQHRPELTITGVHGLGFDRKISVLCPTHGEYFTRHQDLLDGVKCAKCSSGSYGSGLTETVAAMLTELQVEYTTEYRLNNDRRRWDIYVPSKNLVIELDGLYWHSTAVKKDKENINNKALLAESLGVRQINFFEDEVVNKPLIVKRYLENLLTTRPKIGARSCSLAPLSNQEAAEFLDANHLQGASSGVSSVGLRQGSELVAVLSYSNRLPGREGTYSEESLIVNRYATSKRVQGGFSKLLSSITASKTKLITTYSDPRLYTGDLYRKLGFTQVYKGKPDYVYIKNLERFNKRTFQKSWFYDNQKRYNLVLEEGMTEKEMAEANGLYRIYDRGRVRWEKKLT